MVLFEQINPRQGGSLGDFLRDDHFPSAAWRGKVPKAEDAFLISFRTLVSVRHALSAPISPADSLYWPHPGGSPFGPHPRQTSANLPMPARHAAEANWTPRSRWTMPSDVGELIPPSLVRSNRERVTRSCLQRGAGKSTSIAVEGQSFASSQELAGCICMTSRASSRDSPQRLTNCSRSAPSRASCWARP